MRWEWSEGFRGWRDVVAFSLIVAAMLFFMTWMGFGNCSYPRCWGDPIAFTDALWKAPKILVVTFLCIAAAVGLLGLRSGSVKHDRRCEAVLRVERRWRVRALQRYGRFAALVAGVARNRARTILARCSPQLLPAYRPAAVGPMR
jgi:hypothetical protein